MIWRKEALLSIRGFGEDLGVKGNNLSVGEETIAFRRLWVGSEPTAVIYDPALIVFHWVPPGKMKVSYYLKRAFVTGQAAVEIDKQPGLRWRLRTFFRSGGAFLLHSAGAVMKLPRHRHWQNWAVEECTLVASKLGTWMAVCGISLRVKQQ